MNEALKLFNWKFYAAMVLFIVAIGFFLAGVSIEEGSVVIEKGKEFWLFIVISTVAETLLYFWWLYNNRSKT